jgi:ABC-type branched-subunit amino acid transport system substrate-binding protein
MRRTTSSRTTSTRPASKRPTSNRAGVAFLAGVVTLSLALAGCRGGSSSSGGGGGGGKTKAGAPTATVGFDGSTISVGAISPQTGIAAIIGAVLTDGNRVYFDALNSRGGVAGKYKVTLEVRDSQYNSNIAQQNYADLRDKVVMLAQLLGTDITNAVLTPMRQDNMVAAPATLDAEWVRNANLLPVAAPYQIQSINSLAYYVNEAGGAGKTVCVIRADDLYGQAGFNGVEYASKHLNFKLGKVVQFGASETDLTAQLQQVKSGCDAVYLVSLPTVTLPLMGQAASQNVNVQWIGQAPTWVSLLAAGATGAYMQQHFLLAAQGPQWGDTSVPGMKQMLDDIARFKPGQKPDIYFAFGYAQALTVSKLLEKAVELGDLSRAGVMKALDQLGDVDTLGLAGTYHYGPPASRVPPRVSTIFAVDPTQVAQLGGLKALKTNLESDPAKQFPFPK